MTFSSISDLWNKWNIRSFVLLSLSLQVFLILFSPIRKKTANDRIIFILWLAYLMADWVAAFAIGLISHNQGNLCTQATEVDGALQAFWASFLLLHLGGPDTITAFSLEDSSLWRRHLLSLIFQIGAAIYVFVQIFPSNRSLMIPTMLILLVGVIKNVERTLALNLSSLPRLREWVLSQAVIRSDVLCSYNEGFEKFRDHKAGMLYLTEEAIKHFEKDEANYNESTVVELGYCFFEIFKIFLGDLMFSSRERAVSRQHFALMSAMDMLNVISVELQFIYEVLHTKVLAIRSKLSYIFRFITFMCVVVAFFLFYRLKKHQLSKLDVKTTYILLFGGIVLDVIALFMLIFSDRTLAKIMLNNSRSYNKKKNSRSSKLHFLYKLAYDTYKLRKPRLATCKAERNANVTYKALDTPIIFRRWSESISTCNLLSMTLKESPRKMYKCDLSLGRIAFSKLFDFPFHMAEKIISYFRQAGGTIARGCGLRTREGLMIANTRYVSKNPFPKELWIFIIKEVRSKSVSMCEIRKRKMRELTMVRRSLGIMDELMEERHELRNMRELYMYEHIEVRKIFEARGDLFLESLQDEIANGDLLKEYITKANYDGSIIMWHIATEILYNIEKSTEERDERKFRDEREFSKILSDYMLYLFLNQPNVVSAVMGIGQLIAGATLETLLGKLEFSDEIRDVEGLCKKLFQEPQTTVTTTQISKSMLKQGTNLARQMAELGDMKWKVMSGVWVEMLSYAASHIKGEAHVQVLSKGGELLAFTWLLMAHFGCAYKPELGVFYEPYGMV